MAIENVVVTICAVGFGQVSLECSKVTELIGVWKYFHWMSVWKHYRDKKKSFNEVQFRIKSIDSNDSYLIIRSLKVSIGWFIAIKPIQI